MQSWLGSKRVPERGDQRVWSRSIVGWRGGTSPPRSRQTDREPLDSIGFLLAAGVGRLLSLSDWPFHSSPFAQGLCSRAITAPSSLLHPDPPQRVASGTLAFGFLASAYSRSHTFG